MENEGPTQTPRSSRITYEEIRATELRLLEPICTFDKRDGYTVYKSDLFPNYMAGNGIEIHDPQNLSLAEWEDLSGQCFDLRPSSHMSFTFPKRPEFAELIERGKAEGYEVEIEAYMSADHTRRLSQTPSEFEIREILTASDWERSRVFHAEATREYDWYESDAESDQLFEKTRFTSEAVGIRWFYVSYPGGSEILAKLGLFEHQGLWRLQDVMTAQPYRRQGLASFLVSFALREAIDRQKGSALALVTDIDYYAIDLYRKLGFVSCGEAVTLMKYPVKNADAQHPSW